MWKIRSLLPAASLILLGMTFAALPMPRAAFEQIKSRDEQVRNFLESRRSRWRDLNIPETDGRILHEIVLKNGYKRALEIGTSTGHSGIWISWALSKTGGSLVTIEIDEERHRTAVANFKEAGLADLIDARLGDAHKLVPQLEGPFDFVFCDADKEWYKNYLQAVLPKLEPGGCFAAHNVWQSRSGWAGEYLNFARSQSSLETTLERSSASGIALSYKKGEK